MYYEDVFNQLNNKKVRYLVVGGIAVNLYGVPRATMDLDLMVETSKTNLSKLIAVLEELGYKPKVPVKACELADPKKRKIWREEKHMIVFSFIHLRLPYQQIDIFLDNPMDFEEANRARYLTTAKRIKIPLLSIDHLIKLKLDLGREQDLADVEALEKVKAALKEQASGEEKG